MNPGILHNKNTLNSLPAFNTDVTSSTQMWLLTIALATRLASAAQVTPLTCGFFGPLVTPSWLERCAQHLDLVTFDLRDAEAYAASHIPDSLSAPFGPVSVWSEIGPNGLLLEMPPSEGLFEALGNVGIGPATKVVLVNGVGEPAFPQAAGPRVALTLKYAGVEEGRVAVLDGGFPGWEEAFPVTSEVVEAIPVTYSAEEDRSFLVDMEYVAANLHKQGEGIYLLDGRDTEVYVGAVMEDWTQKAGHIPGAISLPAVDVWTEDGGYKSPAELLAWVRAAVGDVSQKQEQLIVYCGVGGYASVLHFVLTRVLGFENVVVYDGSAQEWSRHYDMEV